MTLYIVEPRDSALFRDARPFAGNAPAVSMDRPWPSTVAGLFRTLNGQDENGVWVGNPEEAKKLEVAGPLLVSLTDDDQVADFYFPAPADAVFFREPDSDKIKVRRLHPSGNLGNFISDLPDDLLPTVFESEENPGEATSGPKWWKAEKFFAWLNGKIADGEAGKDFGTSLSPAEERIHVAIDHTTLTADDGKLFSTHMQRFTERSDNQIKRFGLLAWTSADVDKKLAAFGGERRMSRVLPANGELPKPPAIEGTRLRVVLITPGLFSEGWRPSEERLGGAKLVAACVGRPESVSGWDYAVGGPKAARRMAPAGSVYWLDFESPDAAAKWAQEHQYQSIADNEQDRRDGFAIIIAGRA